MMQRLILINGHIENHNGKFLLDVSAMGLIKSLSKQMGQVLESKDHLQVIIEIMQMRKHLPSLMIDRA